MRKLGLTLGALALCCVSQPAGAQENYTNGPIRRVLHVAITPGHGPEFWQDLRQNVKPLFDAYKAQGLIEDWFTFIKSTKEDRDDWDVGLALQFKNWAALDTFAARVDSVVIRHYGTKESRDQAAQRRSQHGTLVSSILVRYVTLKEWGK